MLEISKNLSLSAADDPVKVSAAKKVAETADEIAIFFNNDISTEDSCKCLFLLMALTNHSCCPNSSWTAVAADNPRLLELRAATDIREGEEVTVNYIIQVLMSF